MLDAVPLKGGLHMKITVQNRLQGERGTTHRGGNRAPLLPISMIRLPLGSISPGGWLGHQLELMIDGMPGRLAEVSEYLDDANGWLDLDGVGWEEQPYWLRGLYSLAVLTDDERLNRVKDQWIHAILASQDEDGYFGPRRLRSMEGDDGRIVTDLWPHMIMLDVVISHFEHTGEERVIPFMLRFFEFCRELPDEEFIPISDTKASGTYFEYLQDWQLQIQEKRAGEMLPHIYWLYNQTGQGWLLELARRFYEHIAPPESEWLDHHVVNFAQRFAYQAVFMQQTGASSDLERTEAWYTQHLETWGQQPRGIFAADERIRPGKVDPRQGFETCAMVEFAKNFYQLARITGDTVYGDRAEDIILNHFPAAHTPDHKAIHYLTASNMPQLDNTDLHDFYNRTKHKPQLSFSSGSRYRCCQHNAGAGWPDYARNLWQATSDGGLALLLYAQCTVQARVGERATEVFIEETTNYPFSGEVALRVRGQAAFPIYLRVPGWCSGFGVSVCDQDSDIQPAPGSWVRVEHHWQDGDTVRISMPMEVTTKEWPGNGSVTVDRGPLSYSVRIEEKWNRCGGTDKWPEWEVFPASPWNYALSPGAASLPDSFDVAETANIPCQPWTVESAPVVITARARRVSDWRLGDDNMVPPVPPSPVQTDEPEERISMIPLGCARLRLACLPIVTS